MLMAPFKGTDALEFTFEVQGQLNANPLGRLLRDAQRAILGA